MCPVSHISSTWMCHAISTWMCHGILHAQEGSHGLSCSSHGTHCASTAAGTTYGVAKGALVVAVQVLSCSGTGSTAGVIAGIEYAVQNAAASGRPSVISMSLGGGTSRTQNAAVAAAYRTGVSVVVSAGNDAGDACIGSPNSEPLALTVGSTTSSDRTSGFSNTGPCDARAAPVAPHLRRTALTRCSLARRMRPITRGMNNGHMGVHALACTGASTSGRPARPSSRQRPTATATPEPTRGPRWRAHT